MKKVALGIVTLALGAAAVQAHQTISPVFIGGVANKAEEQQLADLTHSSYAVLRSDEMRQNLKLLDSTYPEIFMRMDKIGNQAENGTIDSLVAAIQARAPHRYVDTAVALVGSTDNYNALAGVTGNNRDASFALGRGHLANWKSDNMVRKSCAVNTVAHEFSHLITTNASSFQLENQSIQDNGAAKNSKQNAVASYLIGTAAQCTWLQSQGYLPKVDFKACVKVFGHRGFNGGRCGQFEKNVPVESRPGLYAEHIIQ